MARDDTKVPAYYTMGKIISHAMYVWVIFGIIVLALRVFLLAFSANASTPFVNFIYTTSATFLNPFRGIFPPRSVSATGYLDVAALFAIIIYALIGWGFKSLIDYIQAKSSQYIRHEQAGHRSIERTEPARDDDVKTHTPHTPTTKPARYM
jgi:uncharacterized protein YggT (Ycf19 family)